MILLKDFNQKLKFFGSNNASSQRCLQLIISNEGKRQNQWEFFRLSQSHQTTLA